MDIWSKLNNDKKIKTICNNKIIVIASANFEETTIPLFCPLCEFPMKTKEDALSFRQSKCCEKCENRWLNVRGIDLLKGQYPDKSSEEWLEYYETRLIQTRPIINLK